MSGLNDRLAHRQCLPEAILAEAGSWTGQAAPEPVAAPEAERPSLKHAALLWLLRGAMMLYLLCVATAAGALVTAVTGLF